MQKEKLPYTPQIRLWDLRAAHDSVALLAGHGDAVYSLAATAGGGLASGSDDRTVRLWSKRGALYGCAVTLAGHSEAVRGVAWRAGTVATASWDTTVLLWEAQVKW